MLNMHMGAGMVEIKPVRSLQKVLCFCNSYRLFWMTWWQITSEGRV